MLNLFTFHHCTRNTVCKYWLLQKCNNNFYLYLKYERNDVLYDVLYHVYKNACPPLKSSVCNWPQNVFSTQKEKHYTTKFCKKYFFSSHIFGSYITIKYLFAVYQCINWLVHCCCCTYIWWGVDCTVEPDPNMIQLSTCGPDIPA